MLNRCRDVAIHLRQRAVEGERELRHEEKVGWDVFSPSPLKQPRAVPFAWDEPNGEKVVQVSLSLISGSSCLSHLLLGGLSFWSFRRARQHPK